MNDTIITFEYCNHRSVTEQRRVRPNSLVLGKAHHHPYSGMVWHLNAYCMARNASRVFLLKDMKDIKIESVDDKYAELVSAIIERHERIYPKPHPFIESAGSFQQIMQEAFRDAFPEGT